MQNSRTFSAAVLILTIVALEVVPFLAIRSLRPPNPVPESAPHTQFSSARAARHVAALASLPHPPGTAAHQRAREYIVGQLEKLGLEPAIKQPSSVYAMLFGTEKGNFAVGPLFNIVARIRGTSPGKAIILVAHYDTCKPAPGAGDDSAGVAAILETVRALKAGPPLKNDVIVLITDGEEQGLLGAFGFVADDEWVPDIGLVLNFDARGNSGPAIMFETSGATTALIREFANAVPHAIANSLTDTVYQRLPNGTDFTHFKQMGMAGFNFAYIDGWRAYHTPLDTPANLSESTLQHQGTYALSLTRHFGDVPLTMSGRDENADAIYFNPWGGVILCYESYFALPFAALTAVILLAIMFALERRGLLRLWPLARSVLAALCWVILIPMVVTIALVYLGRVAGQPAFWADLAPNGENLGSPLAALSIWNAAFALVALVYLPGRMNTRIVSAVLGHAILWLALCLLTSIVLPGASFVFTWPLLLAFGGHAIFLLRKPDEPLSPLREFGVMLCGVPAIVLLSQVIYLLFVGLAPHEVPGLLGPLLVAVLTFGLLLPQLQLVATRWRWALPTIGAVAAVILFVGARLANAYGV
jgi:hypothetical protein